MIGARPKSAGIPVRRPNRLSRRLPPGIGLRGAAEAIVGAVNDSAYASITVEVRGLTGHQVARRAVIDPGVSGYLMLPYADVEELKLELAGSGTALLATGDPIPFDIQDGTVMWD